MATKMKRDSKGRFVGKKRSRKNPGPSKAKLRRHANSMPRDRFGRFLPKKGGRSKSRSRRSYRVNPVGGDLMGLLMDGSIKGGQVVLGKALSRSVPDLVGLPQGGNTGVAVRAATGVAVGWAADSFMPGWGLGEMLLVGALSGAIEDLAVSYGVPWIGPALSRAPGLTVVEGGTAGSYPRSGAGRVGAGRFVQPNGDGMGSYVRNRPTGSRYGNGSGVPYGYGAN